MFLLFMSVDFLKEDKTFSLNLNKLFPDKCILAQGGKVIFKPQEVISKELLAQILSIQDDTGSVSYLFYILSHFIKR